MHMASGSSIRKISIVLLHTTVPCSTNDLITISGSAGIDIIIGMLHYYMMKHVGSDSRSTSLME